MVKLGEFCGFSVNLKCPLPDGELETLISITSDEDLASLIEEYDRVSATSSLPLKIRAILSPPKSLKSVSPPPSTPPSVVNFSLSNSPPFATLNLVPNHLAYRRGGSPRLAYPISHRRDSRNFCHYPCHVQGNPNKIPYQHCQNNQYPQHHHVPQYSNCWQRRSVFNFWSMVDEKLYITAHD